MSYGLLLSTSSMRLDAESTAEILVQNACRRVPAFVKPTSCLIELKRIRVCFRAFSRLHSAGWR